MRTVVQRVTSAKVVVDNQVTGEIESGFLILIGVEEGDTLKDVQYTVKKVVGLRVFEDEEGKMNLNVQQVGGGLLVVSQFTLAADTKKGLRPSFSSADRYRHRPGRGG